MPPHKSASIFKIQSKQLALTGITEYCTRLSGGGQQKTGIARMMFKPYEPMPAVEPAGNLDAKNKRDVIEIFRELKKLGKTIICVTHD